MGLPFVDVILFNNEAELLRYRLQLHAPLFTHFVVVEADLAFSSGRRKQLHAHSALKSLAGTFNVSVVQVPFTRQERDAKVGMVSRSEFLDLKHRVEQGDKFAYSAYMQIEVLSTYSSNPNSSTELMVDH